MEGDEWLKLENLLNISLLMNFENPTPLEISTIWPKNISNNSDQQFLKSALN